MNKQVTIDPVGPAPLPWDSPSDSRANTDLGTDPRIGLSEDSLNDASRNAFPVVANQRSRRDGLGLLAGVGVALTLGAATFMSLSSGREAPEPAAALAQDPVALAAPPSAPQLVAEPGMLVEAPLETHAGTSAHAFAPAAPTTAFQGPTMSPVVVFDGSAAPAASASAGGHAGHAQGSNMLSSATSSSGEVAANSARSTRIADPSTTVVQGTLIAAVLETAINSDVPGFARAVVSQDVRSFDGAKVLIPRSSRLIGEYKTAPSAGQRRVHLIWTRLVRPDGVSIELASPATDISGRAGISGKVNTHFFERLGSALLTSVIGSVSPFGRGASTVVVAGGESAASAAVQGLGQRPPTVRVQQGEPVKVFAARDLVFTPTDGAAE